MQRQLAVYAPILGNFVVEQKAVAVTAKDKRYLQQFGIAKPLLHTVTESVFVIFGLNDCYGHIGFVKKNIISTLTLGAGVQLAAHNNAPFGQGKFFTYLGSNIPPRLLQSRGDEFSADITLAELTFIHGAASLAERRHLPLRASQVFAPIA